MNEANDFYSRERKAGYDPEVNGSIDALVLGCGALAQTVLLNLAMSQVGRLRIIDFDTWDAHNATRSPLFGTPAQRRRCANRKAPCVAAQLIERTRWGGLPRIEYAVGRFQELGDASFRDASVVIWCVDDNWARLHCASMCHRHDKPMIEGGMAGAEASFGVFHGAQNACYQCGTPLPAGRRVPFGCQANAIEQARRGFVAMTQTVASVLGALMAESAIQLAHGNRSLVVHRVHIPDVRRPTIQTVVAKRDPDCVCDHEVGKPTRVLTTPATAPLGELMAELSGHFLRPSVLLDEPYVATAQCVGPVDDPSRSCGAIIDVGAMEWALREQPRCRRCGGEYARSKEARVLEYRSIGVSDEPLFTLPGADVGLFDGAWVGIDPGDGHPVYVALPEGDSPFTEMQRPRRRRG